MAESTFLQRELRRLMKLHGFSARGLSLRAVRPDGRPVNETAVKAILSGKSRNPRMDTVQALADVFGLKTDDLLGPSKGAVAKVEPVQATTRERTIGVLKDLLRAHGADPDGNRSRPSRKRGARKSSGFAPKTRRSHNG